MSMVLCCIVLYCTQLDIFIVLYSIALMMVVATETGSYYCNKDVVVFDCVRIYFIIDCPRFESRG